MQTLKKIKWEVVRDRLLAANPKIGAQIDAIPHHTHPPLYLACYPFGELIVKEGAFQIPFEGRMVSIEEPELPEDLTDDLRYGVSPMLVSLNKTTELFLAINERTHPLHFFNPGKVLGLWPVLDTHPYSSIAYYKSWSLAAGSRTIFMSPKIMDATAHAKMQRQLHLQEMHPPLNLFDQGLVFRAVMSSSKIISNWQSEVLVFSKEWAEHLKSGAWPNLHHALLQQEWDDSLFLRNHLRLEILWQILASAQAQVNLKASTYVIDTVKHLIGIVTNTALGFSPLTEADEIYAPISAIQNIYIDHYGLKQYIPTMLGPAYVHDRPSVYYSLLYPTLPSISPNHNFRNTLEDERNIKYLLKLFRNKLAEYPSYRNLLSDKIQFDFFHFEADPIYQIYSIQDLVSSDPLLRHFPANKELVFAENSPFLRACIKMTAPK